MPDGCTGVVMSLLEQLIDQVLDDKYRIEEKLGQGGMGAVYLATHLGTQRPVALKVIAPEFMTNKEFVERFKREAEAAGRLRHSNVVNVTDFGCARVGSGQVAYLVMEYLDGCSLGEVLEEEKRLPLGWVVDIVEQVCSAIDEAHNQGIIHRDLKPDNIWLKPNRRGGYTIKVLDFGLAKLGEAAQPNLAARIASAGQSASPKIALPQNESPTLSAAKAIQPPQGANFFESDTMIQPPNLSEEEEEEKTRIIDGQTTPGGIDPQTISGSLTRVGSVLGTPLYMSPEQCRGETLNARSDIYSLGVITYQMLAGETPFKGNMHTLVAQHMEAPPPPLKNLRGDIPKPVAELVMSALSKNPAERPVSAAAFASALRANAEGPGTLLRQALALYSEHFPTFIRISLIGYIPFIAFKIMQLLNKAQMDLNIAPRPFGKLTAFFLGMFLVVSELFAKAVNAGAFVPVVAQLRVAPLRKVQIRPIFKVLKKRLRSLAITTVHFYISCILRLLFFIIPGVKAYINFSLYAPVVMMEGEEGKGALVRSQTLVGRLKRTVIVILALDLFIGSKLAGAFATVFTDRFNITGNIAEVITILFAVFINPIFAIAFAMLYFKTRQAGGETLNEVLGQQFEDTALPSSKWQSRIIERSRLTNRSDNRTGSRTNR
jgi:serine/threonine protein kinase